MDKVCTTSFRSFILQSHTSVDMRTVTRDPSTSISKCVLCDIGSNRDLYDCSVLVPLLVRGSRV